MLSGVIVNTFTKSALGEGIPVEGRTLVGATSKTFEKFWGSSNYEERQVKRLLLRAISALKKEIKA